MQALAEIKQGDPAAALRTLDGLAPTSLPGRLAQALAYSGAAVMGFATPEPGTAKAAECRRLALESGDRSALVIASWAQAAAAHARDDLRESLWADLLDTHALRELAVSVFDGHLCMTQRLLYGARPYPDVVAFAEAFRAEAERLGAARGLAFATTLRGEAKLLSGRLGRRRRGPAARRPGSTGPSGPPPARRWRCSGRPRSRCTAADPRRRARCSTRRSPSPASPNVGFHLLDRIYGTRITAAADPADALVRLDEAERAVRGPLETCPGCRITLAVPAAIAAARGGDLDRAARYARDTETLATVVMRLPGWDAALARGQGPPGRRPRTRRDAAAHFRAAAARLRGARANPWTPPGAPTCAQERSRNTRLTPSAAMSNHATTIATAVQLLNAGDVDGYVTTLYHPDARFHGFPPDFGADRDGITEFFRALRAGIPDATIAAAGPARRRRPGRGAVHPHRHPRGRAVRGARGRHARRRRGDHHPPLPRRPRRRAVEPPRRHRVPQPDRGHARHRLAGPRRAAAERHDAAARALARRSARYSPAATANSAASTHAARSPIRVVRNAPRKAPATNPTNAVPYARATARSSGSAEVSAVARRSPSSSSSSS